MKLQSDWDGRAENGGGGQGMTIQDSAGCQTGKHIENTDRQVNILKKSQRNPLDEPRWTQLKINCTQQ